MISKSRNDAVRHSRFASQLAKGLPSLLRRTSERRNLSSFDHGGGAAADDTAIYEEFRRRIIVFSGYFVGSASTGGHSPRYSYTSLFSLRRLHRPPLYSWTVGYLAQIHSPFFLSFWLLVECSVFSSSQFLRL